MELSIIGSGNKKKRRDLVAELNEMYSNVPKSKSNKKIKQEVNGPLNLENKLEKPEVILTSLEKTAVNPQTQKQHDTLMQIYECGGWRWSGGNLPTELDHWKGYKEETCVESKEKFGYCGRKSYGSGEWKVISTQEFYKKQNIPQDQIKEINK